MLDTEIIKAGIEHVKTDIVLIALCMSTTIGAMAVDLIVGVAKAKKRGEARTSTGYKKTAEKAVKYFTPFFVLVMIDLLCSVIIPLPAFSMLWTCYCVFCEFVSVREKSWEKEELRKAEKTVRVIVENKDDIAKIVSNILFHQDENKEEKEPNRKK